MARRSLIGRRVVITGASAGIGRALAREFARRGARLLLNARREELLRSVSDELSAGQAEVIYVPGDITTEDVRHRIRQSIEEHWGALDILVNNAGVGAIGPFAEADMRRLTRILDVNFVAPAELIRSLIALLLRGAEPVIVNMGSVLGHVAAPYKSEYCASKFAMLGFSNALRMELQPSGIAVLVVSPSTTASDFFANLLDDSSAANSNRSLGLRPELVSPPNCGLGLRPELLPKGMSSGRSPKLRLGGRSSGQSPELRGGGGRWVMTPEYVARRVANALETRKRELFLPPVSGWIMPLLRACPSLSDWLAKRWSTTEGQPP